jgi:hypothetical protein
MKTRPDDAKRHETLTSQIEKFYDSISEDDLQQLESEMEISITEMFEITKIAKSSVELSHFFEEERFSPVYLPEPIMKLVKMKDIFLMTIGKSEEGWEVLYMGPPYSTGYIH